MKKTYFNPSLKVVAFQQKRHILSGSKPYDVVDNNAGLEFEGGGDGEGAQEPMAREFDDDFLDE